MIDPTTIQQQFEAERNAGKLQGLLYGKSMIDMRRAGSRKTPDYLAGLNDIEIFLDAAVERVRMGLPMNDTADTQSK